MDDSMKDAELPFHGATPEQTDEAAPKGNDRFAPSLIQGVDRIVSEVLESARPRRKRAHSAKGECVRELWESVGEAGKNVLPPSAKLSNVAAAAWRRHVLTNLNLLDASKSRTEGSRSLEWRQTQPPDIGHFLARNLIELLPSIGTNYGAPLEGVLFVGPKYNRILIDCELVPQPLEVAFLIYHLYIHFVAGHTPRHQFGVRFEYGRGRTPMEVLADSEYGEQEGIADDGATCLWDDWYVDAYRMSDFSRSLARGAISSGASSQLIRSVLRNRKGLFYSVWRTVGSLTARTKDSNLYLLLNDLSPSLKFNGPFAVVEGTDRHAYLICLEPDGQKPDQIKGWRRWIPSRRVLTRLGLASKDIVRISDEELSKYEDVRLLIEPQDVRQVRDALMRAASKEEGLVGIAKGVPAAASWADVKAPGVLKNTWSTPNWSTDEVVRLARELCPEVTRTPAQTEGDRLKIGELVGSS